MSINKKKKLCAALWSNRHKFQLCTCFSQDISSKLIPQHSKFTKEAKELDIQEKVIKRCYDVVKYLYKVLGEVYGPEELEMIQHICNVLDLEETLEVIKEKGPL